jgi:hypothetical protein
MTLSRTADIPCMSILLADLAELWEVAAAFALARCSRRRPTSAAALGRRAGSESQAAATVAASAGCSTSTSSGWRQSSKTAAATSHASSISAITGLPVRMKNKQHAAEKMSTDVS